jgi:hypothetical protein
MDGGGVLPELQARTLTSAAEKKIGDLCIRALLR